MFDTSMDITFNNIKYYSACSKHI